MKKKNKKLLVPQCLSNLVPFKRAFTLAEVLITLGIIGVVAAMTIPTLVTNYQKRVMVNKAKLAHSQLHNAIKLYSARNDCYGDILCLFNTNKTSYEVAQDLSSVLKGSKVCNPNISSSKREENCKSSYSIKDQKTPHKVDGKYAAGDSIGVDGRIILQNGTLYRVAQRASCYNEYTYVKRDEFGFDTGERYTLTSDTCAIVYVDTNGITEPNQYGRDIYRYNVSAEGKIASWGDMINLPLYENRLDYVEYNFGDFVPGYEE